MTEQGPGQMRARELIGKLIAQRRLAPASVSRQSDLDPGTVRDFLQGVRWPRPRTLAAIEDTLGLPVGTIDGIASGRVDSLAEVERHLVGPEPLPAGDVERYGMTDIAREQLNPALAGFTDRELILELEGRLLLLATELHARGEPTLITVVDDDGHPRFTSSAVGRRK